AAIFQSRVASRCAGEKMADYITLASGVTQSSFESVTVVTNWTPNLYMIGTHTISSLGTLVTSKDGSLTAGIFISYNNKALSAGDHYLIVEKSAKLDSIRVWQPLGNDTQLTLERPSVWPDSNAIHVFAVKKDTAISVNNLVTSESITFDWKRQIAGSPVDYYLVTSDVVVAVDDKPASAPVDFRLFQNYPNPFNAATRIAFALHQASQVKIEVFNLVGEKVAALAEGHFDVGYHAVNFDAVGLPSGIYIYRIQAGRFGESRKLVVLK
ncbi:T9SS type A sorting domain-containing protein, partial [bacterium]|nr:T9SS type A sorting domain-containing protein [bacterium]